MKQNNETWMDSNTLTNRTEILCSCCNTDCYVCIFCLYGQKTSNLLMNCKDRVPLLFENFIMARPCGNSKATRLSTCHHHQENLTSLLTEVFLPVIMADRRVLCFSVVLSYFLVFASYISNLTYLNWFSNAQAQTWERFSSTRAAY